MSPHGLQFDPRSLDPDYWIECLVCYRFITNDSDKLVAHYRKEHRIKIEGNRFWQPRWVR